MGRMDYKGDLYYIGEVLGGNKNAFTFLVDRHKDHAYNLALKICGSREEAEEIAQDAFIKAYRSLAQFKMKSSFATWFYRIVYNTALTKLSNTKRKIENEMSSIDDLHYLESNYNADDLVKEDLSVLVKKIVNELPPKNAAVITMFYLEEMSGEAISDVLQISVANVKVILHRSRNLLRQIIEKRNLFQEVL